jgi:hypothetical protein
LKTLQQSKDSARLGGQTVTRVPGDIVKRLESAAVPVQRDLLGQTFIDPLMIPSYIGKQEQLRSEQRYRQTQLKFEDERLRQNLNTIPAATGGEEQQEKRIKDASRLNQLIQQELQAQNRLGLIGKDELSQIEAKAQLAKEILSLTLKDIRLTETGAIQAQSITNATLAYQVTVAELNQEWDEAIRKIGEVEKDGKKLYQSILEQKEIEQSPLQKALKDVEDQAQASIDKIDELLTVLSAQAGTRPEGLAARKFLGNLRSSLQERTPEQANMAASQKITRPIKEDLESQLQGLLNAGKTLTTLDQVILKIGSDWSALSPEIQSDLTNLANRIDAAKPFAEIASAIRESREELTKLTSTSSLTIASANTISSAFGNAFKGIVSGSMTAREALAGMFQSIADSFADMVAQMIVEWIKMMVLKGIEAIINPMAGLASLGGGGGGLSSGFSAGTASAIPTDAAGWGAAFSTPLKFATGGIAPGGFTAFANGGMVTGPTMGLVGEGRYNEAIVPLPNGKSIPVELGGASQGNVNVVVNVDAKGSQVEGNEAQSKQLGRVVSAAVQAEIVKQQRPGGLLSSSRSF